jgi:hypothetical protein
MSVRGRNKSAGHVNAGDGDNRRDGEGTGNMVSQLCAYMRDDHTNTQEKEHAVYLLIDLATPPMIFNGVASLYSFLSNGEAGHRFL